MQKLWEVQPQGLVLVLHPGQVQLCNCNNLKVAESTNWNSTVNIVINVAAVVSDDSLT